MKISNFTILYEFNTTTTTTTTITTTTNNNNYNNNTWSRDIAVVIATKLRARRSEVWIPTRARVFSLLQDATIGPSSILFNVCRDSWPQLRQPGRNVNTHLELAARINKEWSFSSILICLHGVYMENCYHYHNVSTPLCLQSCYSSTGDLILGFTAWC
jgi:hypothetical protein